MGSRTWTGRQTITYLLEIDPPMTHLSDLLMCSSGSLCDNPLKIKILCDE